MYLNYLFVLFVLCLVSNSSNAQKDEKYFRKDYTFIEASQSFYKIHTTHRTWSDAKRTCALEGASLFFPENTAEAQAVVSFWTKSEPLRWMFLGISASVTKGVFETIDGRPVSDVYNSWGPGQPDDTDGVEDCVIMRRDGNLNDIPCSDKYSFICKKSLVSLNSTQESDMPNLDAQKDEKYFRKDYKFIEASQSFYKIHTTHRTWSDAKRTCAMEGASLFFPENTAEAQAVVSFWTKSQPLRWMFLGISASVTKGVFETIDGRPVSDVYNSWGPGQPDNTDGVEDCVIMRRDGNLNDIPCSDKYSFICKKSLVSLNSTQESDMPNPDAQKDEKYFRKDYTFIEASQSFYKIHTTHRTWSDAKRTCALEGASLFFPENTAEAQAVVSFWTKSQPLRWMFLGISASVTKGVFETIDGRPVSDVYNSWGPGQPDNTGGVEDCVIMRRDGNLNDIPCSDKYSFICKKSLVSLNSTQESDMPNPGRPVSDVYNSWGPGQPDNTDGVEDCVIMRRDGNLNDIPCSDKYSFICKKSLVSLNSTQESDMPNPDAQKDEKYFRKDYTFIEASQSFYKIHTTHRTWSDAKRTCALEGASLFFPENTAEAQAVVSFWTKSQPLRWMFLGISASVTKGVFETIDGRPVSDVYNSWGPGQPDNTGGVEDCVIMRRDGNLNDIPCSDKYSFICKKSLVSLNSTQESDMPNPDAQKDEKYFRKDYTFIEASQSFYKIHTTHRTWSDAKRTCALEGASLFFPENTAEAQAVVSFWTKSQPLRWMFLGISASVTKGVFETIDGRPVSDVYNSWGPGQPDNTDGVEDCVIMRRDGNLNDIPCSDKYSFICKKSLVSLNSTQESDMPNPDAQKDEKYFRKDYTFIEASQSFYKIHTTHRTWSDAKRTCALEGASLFFPENTAEAQAVVSFWTKSEPLRWMFLGISALVTKGVFETIDGRPVSDVYNSWGPGQPDDTDGVEDCVIMRRDGNLNDIPCSDKYSFICKKSLVSLNSTQESDMPNPDAQKEEKYFRKDYTFIEASQSFYKIHTTHRTWSDAKRTCALEGASLFFPENTAEAQAVVSFWTKSQPLPWMFLGISALVTNGVFETIDGRPVSDVYNSWGPGQPDNTDGVEDCVIMSRDGNLNDISCSDKYSFICKKSLVSLNSTQESDMPNPDAQKDEKYFRKDYTFIEASQSFYKIHTTHRTWSDAKRTCALEGASLFFPENTAEAQAVVSFWTKSQPLRWMFLGISASVTKGVFETIDSRPVSDVYNSWGPGQPDNTDGVEDCVIMRRDGNLNDVPCSDKYSFICKKSLASLNSTQESDMPNPDAQKEEKYFRKDYTFIEASQSFYKIHTTYRTWSDAKRTCALEGASLFFPENTAEAQAVVSFWTKSQPLPWMFLGISALVTKGVFETIDGRPVSEVYNSWGPCQPDDTDGVEDCVIMRRDGNLNDIPCSDKYSFICKKSLVSLNSTQESDMPNLDAHKEEKYFRKDYTFIEASQSFYKIHTTHRTWSDAKRTCALEGASLFFPENTAEAQVVVSFWTKSQPLPWMFLGISALVTKGVFETIDGRPVSDVYNSWGPGQPDDTDGVEDCVIMRRDGNLNDTPCSDKYSFICKKSLVSLNSTQERDMPNLDAHKEEKYFRKDYTFIEASQSFYKIHTTHRTWSDAKRTCALEGASLFFPENTAEAQVIVSFWTKSQPLPWMFLGISALVTKRVFETIDGRPVSDVYNSWGPGQPDNTDGVEDCVIMRRDGNLNDIPCSDKYSFICKKSLVSLNSTQESDVPNPDAQKDEKYFRKDYTFIEASQSFYKIHTTHRTWSDAKRMCALEGASLFFPENTAEAQAVVSFWTKSQPLRWMFLGISALVTKGVFETIDGRPVSDVYNSWGPGQPDDTDGVEDCVIMRRDGNLNDTPCSDKYSFICKKSLVSLNSTQESDMPNLDAQKEEKYFRKDYTFIEASQSFYKIHTTHRTWSDAKRTCALEGASLFFPENTAEAQVVVSFWTKSQPLPWMFLGISALVTKGVFETIDGRPVSDVYNSWGPGQPDNTDGVEDCVIMRRDGNLNDIPCSDKYSFICKKSLVSLNSTQESDMPNPDAQKEEKYFRKDYTFIEASQSFYKIHTTHRTWSDAKRTCALEGASLFFPENTAEAQAVVSFWTKSQPLPWMFLGMSAFVTKGVFETIDGRPVSDVYNSWGPGQPDNADGVEDCVIMRRDGNLNDIPCSDKYSFICKKSLVSLNSTQESDMPNLDAQKDEKYFRKDYTFIEASQSFYKIHTTHRTWSDAKRMCALEGASLFFPENTAEAQAVLSFWTKSQPLRWMFLGISALVTKGVFETIDGRPVSDVYNSWGPCQPDDTNGVEDCVIMRRDGNLNDIPCSDKYSFICKKSLVSLNLTQESDMPNPDAQKEEKYFRKDYTFIEASQSFYKIHTTHRTWSDAKRTCALEGASLFFPENTAEAQVVVSFWTKSQPLRWMFLGISASVTKGVFETIDGRPVSDVYNSWGPGQPDDTDGVEDCVIMRKDGNLNDVPCSDKYSFICKKSLVSLNSTQESDMPNLDAQKDEKYFRKDYTFIEASQSFYKIHTTHRTWSDAKRTCALEGASLFFPENTAEAQAVVSFWTKSQPLRWMFLGISALVTKGVFETIDGRPVSDVYNSWGPCQPDDTNGVEDCVIMRRDGNLNDIPCSDKYSFICKKSLVSLNSTQESDMPNPDAQKEEKYFRTDYTFIEASQSFYKIHTTHRTWSDAKRTCALEGASLFFPENTAEAQVVVSFWTKSQPLRWMFLGISASVTKGVFETIDGRPVSDVYNSWGPDQPDDTDGVEDCVIMRRDGNLNDVPCSDKYSFICKKSLVSLNSTQESDMPNLDAQKDEKYFRKDYTFIEASQSFYKIHTTHRTWSDAKRTCALEGASLFFPENTAEAQAVVSFWTKSQPLRCMFLGISALVTKGVFETIDGRPVSDVYNSWGPCQPDDTDGVEDCVIMRRNGNLNDIPCSDKYSFICKKSLVSLNWNRECDMPNLDYTFNEQVGRCYKFHLNPMNWTDADTVCNAEQSYLSVINSQVEADALVQLTANAPKDQITGNFMRGAVHLGFHNRNDEGWQTARGTTLEDSGYAVWGNGQPDGGARELCGSMFYNGRLNDIGCEQKAFFICEHEIDSLYQVLDDIFGT